MSAKPPSHAQIFLNGEPLLCGCGREHRRKNGRNQRTASDSASAECRLGRASSPRHHKLNSRFNNLLKPTSQRIITPQALAGLQRQSQDSIDRMVKALDAEAHFYPYAPPSFIGFRQGSYLQLSTSTPLDAPASSSRYKLAALAFDDHVSHLIRPILDYFPPEVDFDGVDFSTTIHPSGDSKSEAVEFFFPTVPCGVLPAMTAPVSNCSTQVRLLSTASGQPLIFR